MTEDQARKAQAQAREFPETMEIMAKLRGALAERVFKTAISAQKEREDLYLRVQTLDAMMLEMQTLLTTGASEKAMDEYAKQIATTGE